MELASLPYLIYSFYFIMATRLLNEDIGSCIHARKTKRWFTRRDRFGRIATKVISQQSKKGRRIRQSYDGCYTLISTFSICTHENRHTLVSECRLGTDHQNSWAGKMNRTYSTPSSIPLRASLPSIPTALSLTHSLDSTSAYPQSIFSLYHPMRGNYGPLNPHWAHYSKV